jgi:putative membrane protein
MAILFNKDQKQRIAQAIDEAEQQTSGELVAVLAQTSDDYLYIPILWAALIALAVPGILMLSGWSIDFARIYQFQVSTFILLTILFHWRILKMSLIPPLVKKNRAALRARDEFLTLGLHNTSNRGAIMIFVSVAERYVEILADQGVSEKVAEDVWVDIVSEFVGYIKQDDFTSGYVETIKRCGDIMATHFPPGTGKENELTNQLIEV